MKNKIENIHVVKDSNDIIWDKVLNCAKVQKIIQKKVEKILDQALHVKLQKNQTVYYETL